jgi:hypothetical protein
MEENTWSEILSMKNWSSEKIIALINSKIIKKIAENSKDLNLYTTIDMPLYLLENEYYKQIDGAFMEYLVYALQYNLFGKYSEKTIHRFLESENIFYKLDNYLVEKDVIFKMFIHKKDIDLLVKMTIENPNYPIMENLLDRGFIVEAEYIDKIKKTHKFDSGKGIIVLCHNILYDKNAKYTGFIRKLADIFLQNYMLYDIEIDYYCCNNHIPKKYIKEFVQKLSQIHLLQYNHYALILKYNGWEKNDDENKSV